MGTAETALHEIFGFDAFRPGQAEAVQGALEGRDVLVVMPTGAGKSLCYQLPSLLRDDLSIVVSPLVSLMADQVGALQERAPGRVALVNSQQDAAENREVMERARAGELRLLYVAPERFASPGFLEALRDIPIGIFTVDEAHCVSQWGHDFRPDYFRLGDAARWLGADSLFASTATATPQVAADIVARLGLREPVRVATGFDRPNLTFAVVPTRSPEHSRAQLAAALAEPGSRPAIVYAGTRKLTEQVAEDLAHDLGIEVLAYHAGLDREKRAETQRRFMDGEVEVVVATNAFGMGIDKADVRSVVHVSVPQSLEGWYQEAGRAGRDGLPSRALMLAQPRDKGLHVYFIERSEIEEAELDRIAAAIVGSATDGRYDIALQEVGGDPDQVRATVGHLVRAGVLRPAPSPADRLAGRVEAPYDGKARSLARTSAKEGVSARWRQYRAVWAFVEGDGCRRAAILRHFGDGESPHTDAGVPCCDACEPGAVADVLAVAAGRGRPAPSRRKPAEVDEEGLEAAIIEVVGSARPAVGRTRTVEILRGGRSKALLSSGHDRLEHYGAFGDLHADEVMARVDGLIAGGALASSGGRYPKLSVAGEKVSR
ncbi:MAG: RecQ family ATP-dependent DNA helicase [Solirubrobacterales bacterium]